MPHTLEPGMPDSPLVSNRPSGWLDHVLWVPAAACLLAQIAVMYANGFLALTADEFCKGTLAWGGVRDVRVWFSTVWLPGHLAAIGLVYVLVDNLWQAIRLVPILCGLLTVLGVYRLGYLLAGRGTAVLASLLAATTPLVVWLSATGLSDMVCAGPFVLGLSVYLHFYRSGRLRDLYVACALFGLATTVHYVAWPALVAPSLGLAWHCLSRRGMRLVHYVAGLTVAWAFPLFWCVHNRIQQGRWFGFLRQHVDESSAQWRQWNYEPSLSGALKVLSSSAMETHLAVGLLAVPSVFLLLRRRPGRGAAVHTWLFVLFFMGMLAALYATGGRPSSYYQRYQLLPALAMACLGGWALSRLLSATSRGGKAFGAVLIAAVLLAGVTVTLTKFAKANDGHSESLALAEAFRELGVQSTRTRALHEIKYWNHDQVKVFLNDPDAITQTDPTWPNCVLRFDEQSFVQFAKSDNIRFLSVCSEDLLQHVSRWRSAVPRMKVGTYTIFELRPTRSGGTTTAPATQE